MSTSDWSELDRVVGLMRVPARLKQTRILAWGGLKWNRRRLHGRSK